MFDVAFLNGSLLAAITFTYHPRHVSHYLHLFLVYVHSFFEIVYILIYVNVASMHVENIKPLSLIRVGFVQFDEQTDEVTVESILRVVHVSREP